ncbi:hypothetical protein [Sabulicella glaciei]|uniref:DUF3955 domain-containing protein n=1 Tax=Sabulicella glaciei TaxID=2984948 RepID=A0ABT3P0V0_9PROT|nr:hypothetical protein [Roseococcus sp. MDT2-1-1]MCW8088021.1 hypothetical protein [Roseococcus sp. MDT2-1-1]
MRVVVALLLLLAAALGAFAWWGQYTVAGRTRYDEMDGLYPLGAGLLAGFLILAAAGVAWLAARQRKR